jgi:hypothetical protein
MDTIILVLGTRKDFINNVRMRDGKCYGRKDDGLPLSGCTGKRGGRWPLLVLEERAKLS